MTQLGHGSQKWIQANSQRWQRWLVAGLVLLLAPAIGYVASPGYARLLLLGILGLVAAVAGIRVLFRWPALGLVLLIPANMVVPFSIGTGTQTSINMTVLLVMALLALWLYQMWQQGGGLKLYSPATMTPLLLLLVVTVIAFVAGQLPWFPRASRRRWQHRSAGLPSSWCRLPRLSSPPTNTTNCAGWSGRCGSSWRWGRSTLAFASFRACSAIAVASMPTVAQAASSGPGLLP
jgi:hypothetical protein